MFYLWLLLLRTNLFHTINIVTVALSLGETLQTSWGNERRWASSRMCLSSCRRSPVRLEKKGSSATAWLCRASTSVRLATAGPMDKSNDQPLQMEPGGSMTTAGHQAHGGMCPASRLSTALVAKPATREHGQGSMCLCDFSSYSRTTTRNLLPKSLRKDHCGEPTGWMQSWLLHQGLGDLPRQGLPPGWDISSLMLRNVRPD